MCATCGCSDHEHVHDHDHGHVEDPDHHHHDHAPHAHAHEDHDHDHVHRHDDPRLVKLEHDLLAKNRSIATRNRAWLAGRNIVAWNFVSSPGAGKTSLLERLIRMSKTPISVIEGDQATENDARRIREAGANAVQVNTGAGCHLDAAMVARALETLDPREGSMLIIENVGNLVCPALFDLGERAKVVVASVTEGDDKPAKYPHMYRASDLMVLNKIDLLPHVAFDVDRCMAYAASVNPKIKSLQVSATRGDGLEDLMRALSRGGLS